MSAIPDPFPLRNIPVPAEVTAVAGCDCGGLTWHADSCSLWDVPTDVAIAAVDAAEDRLRQHTADLNTALRAALPSARLADLLVDPPAPPGRTDVQWCGAMLSGEEFYILGTRARVTIEWPDGLPGGFTEETLREYGRKLSR
jgi:hypothetical protein